MSLTGDELAYIVDRLIEEGVPAGIIARTFELEEDLVRKQQKLVRIRRYGTADMEEYLEQVQWDLIDKVRESIAGGKVADAARYSAALKSMMGTDRRVPDSIRAARDNVLGNFEEMRSAEPQQPKERSRFVAIAGGAEDG